MNIVDCYWAQFAFVKVAGKAWGCAVMAGKKTRRGGKRSGSARPAPKLSPNAPHSIEFYKDPSDGSIPSLETFSTWPNKVAKKILPIVAAVAEAPPTKFAGGGKWEAMHGECTGMFEVRAKVDGIHYRFFCVLDLEAANSDRPLLTVLDADSKPDRTVFPAGRYEDLVSLRDEYFKPDKNGQPVRSLALPAEVHSIISEAI